MQNTRTIAVIDLGSNSFHMMVAQTQNEYLRILDTLKEPVRLRMGLRADGTITQAARQRALDCLTRFAQRIRRVDEIRVVGTNTLRRAQDAKRFLKEMEEVLRAPVEVIGGMEEARLIYQGVAHYLPPSADRNFVIDIGGGSTELIIGKHEQALTRESRSIGCVSFTLDYFEDGIVTPNRFNQAVLRVGQELEALQQPLHKENWDRVIGASGTVKAVGGVLAAMGGDKNIITRAGLNAIRDRIMTGKKMSATPLPGLRDDRVPVFAGGFALLFGVFEAFDIDRMTVSAYSLREGLLLDCLGRAQNKDIREETVNRLKSFYKVDIPQAERVRKTVGILLQRMRANLSHGRNTVQKILGWAADLHEIGLAIAHAGFHKHGAYILLNGDMDGFSRVEQCLLAFLVLNQRKRLKTEPLPYETKEEWPLVFIMRLACLLNRERMDIALPAITIRWRGKKIELFMEPDWLVDHPLTQYDLELEQGYWQRIGYCLILIKPQTRVVDN